MDNFEKLQKELLRLRQYYPYRIVWGFICADNTKECPSIFLNKFPEGEN